jgi:hypothetical protein
MISGIFSGFAIVDVSGMPVYWEASKQQQGSV